MRGCAIALLHPARCCTQSADATPHLQKEPGPWGSLTATGDKAALRARREASIARAHAAQAAAAEARAARKRQEEK